MCIIQRTENKVNRRWAIRRRLVLPKLIRPGMKRLQTLNTHVQSNHELLAGTFPSRYFFLRKMKASLVIRGIQSAFCQFRLDVSHFDRRAKAMIGMTFLKAIGR